MTFLPAWRKYFVRIALPAFLFLCLEFHYKAMELVSAREAVLSFLLLCLLFFAGSAVLSFVIVLLQRPFKKDFLNVPSFFFVTLLTVFIFLMYLPYLTDGRGQYQPFFGRRSMLMIAFAIAATFIAFLWKKGKLSPPPASLTGASNRFFKFSVFLSLVAVAGLSYGFVTSDLRKNSAPSHPGEGWNVLVIVIDTLSGLHLSSYGYTANRTPELDRMAASSYLFRNARTVYSGTPVSMMHMLKGQSPLKTRFLSCRPMPPSLTRQNLFSVLEGAGYRTESLVGETRASLHYFGFPLPTEGEAYHRNADWIQSTNRTLAVLARRLGFSLRFQVPTVSRLFGTRPFFDQVLGRIDALSEHDEPFFLYAHTIIPYLGRLQEIDPSTTFRYENHDFSADDPNDRAMMTRARAAYDDDVSRIDTEMGRLMETLERKGILKNTVVVFTADHGESFDHGWWGHGDDLSENTIRIPLIIKAPGHAPQTIDKAVQNSDIAPTVLDLLGISAPEWMDGLSGIDPTQRHEAAFTFNFLAKSQMREIVEFPGLSMGHSVAYYKDGFKLIEHPEGKKDELYDLTKDPSEKRNLLEELPEKVRELRLEMSRALGISS